MSFQPVALSAASTGAASGASIAAVAPLAGIVQQHAEIVLEAEEQMGLRRHVGFLLCIARLEPQATLRLGRRAIDNGHVREIADSGATHRLTC